MMYQRTESEYFTAKRKAARQLGVEYRHRPGDLPSNREIRDEIQVMARMHEGDSRTEKLRREILGALAAAAPANKDVIGLIRHAARTPMGPPGPRAHAAGLLLKIGGELALEELLADAREEVLDQVISAASENPAMKFRNTLIVLILLAIVGGYAYIVGNYSKPEEPQSLLGVACPLTVWEDTLRGRRPSAGFLVRLPVAGGMQGGRRRQLVVGRFRED
jgi:hypothetical protein